MILKQSILIVELVLNRLGLKDILSAEMERLEESAAKPVVRWQNESLAQDHNNQRDHIAQTQKILANIRRHNQQEDDPEEDRLRSNPEKKRKIADHLFKSSKKAKEAASPASPVETVLDETELPSELESPPISSTRIDSEKSIFMFSQGDDDDDSVFDL